MREQEIRVPISEKNPNGKTGVDSHCRKNPSDHEIFVTDEIHEIAELYFDNLKILPTPDNFGNPKGNDFDRLIGGWTQFWNDTGQPLYSGQFS